MRIASTYPGVTAYTFASGSFLGSTGSLPSNANEVSGAPRKGIPCAAAASVTPGISRARRRNSSVNRWIAAPSGYLEGGSEIPAVSTCPASKPGCTPVMRPKLRKRRPAPISSTIESATSVTIRPLRRRAWLLALRTSLSRVWTDGSEARSAGKSPNPTPVKSETAAVKPSASTSMRTSLPRGREASSGASASSPQ